MYDLITTSEIKSLSTLNTTFPDLFHTQLTIYSTGDGKNCQKTDSLLQWFSILHNGHFFPNTWSFGAPLSPMLEI